MDLDLDDTITFENLTDLPERLARVWESTSHVTLLEVIDRNQTEQIARLNLTSQDIEPWLREAEADETHVQHLARGVDTWVKATVAHQMYGRGSGKFKLMVWSPKGTKCQFALRFGAVSSEWDDEPLPLPTPSDAAPATSTHEDPDWILRRAKTVLSMSESSTHWLLQAARGIISDLQAHLRRQTQEYNRLLDVFLSQDRLAATAITSSTQEAERMRLRAELGKSTIEQLGKVTTHMVAGWNKLDPELMDVLSVIQDDDELMRTLKSPKVRSFLKDPAARAALKRVLVQFGAAYAEPSTADEREPAAQPPSSTPPSPTSPPQA